MALTQRDIDILNYRISELNALITQCMTHEISVRKIDKLKDKRARYQEQLNNG